MLSGIDVKFISQKQVERFTPDNHNRFVIKDGFTWLRIPYMYQ